MKYLGLSFYIPVSAAAGYFLGVLLDRAFSTHFFYLVFLLLGIVGGMTAMIRDINKNK